MKIEDYVKNKLNKNIDLKYKEFTKNLCDTSYHMLGVRLPILRSISKEVALSKDFLANDKEKYMKIQKNDTFEEVMIKGFLIEYVKEFEFDKKLKLFENFIPYIDNWSVCDSVITTLKFIKKDRKKVWKFLDKYFKSEKEFYLRAAIVVSMDYFIVDEYIDLVLDKYKEIVLKDYYVKMALAWSLSMIYINYKEKVLDFLNSNNLDNFTHNKSIQKMIESYKVSEEDKNYLKRLKKKG